MAATCSHVLTNVTAHPEIRVPSHSRDLSTISSATLHTNTTVHSQPTEPLLRPTTPQAGQHYDIPSHQSRDSTRLLPRWSQSHVMSHRHSAAIVSEKGLERNPIKRVKSLRRIKNALAILMGKFLLYLCLCQWLEMISTPRYRVSQQLVLIYLLLSNTANDCHF